MGRTARQEGRRKEVMKGRGAPSNIAHGSGYVLGPKEVEGEIRIGSRVSGEE